MIRLEMSKKQEIVLAIIILVATLGAFVLFSWSGRTTVEEPAEEPVEEPAEEQKSLISVILDQIEKQAKVDERLLGELDSGEYGLYNPLVSVNPYGKSPLTALVLFTTNEPMRVSVHITGKTVETYMDYSFDDLNTRHIIPVLGLYPDMLNLVEIVGITQNGGLERTWLVMRTDPMPKKLRASVIATNFEQFDTPDQDLYFTFVQKSAFDVNGDFRWFYSDLKLNNPTSYTDDGNMLFILGSFDKGDAFLLEVNKLGRIMSVDSVNAGEVSGFDSFHVERRSIYTDTANDMGIGTEVRIPK